MLQLRRINTTPVSQVLAAILVAASIAGPASASKRAPAPIVYNDTTPTARMAVRPSPPTRMVQATAGGAPSEDRATRRMEFRYPDQPGTYHGAGGARSVEKADPVAFSSSQAAISPGQAASYSAAQAPQFVTESGSRNPALTPGAFDAREAAQQITAARQAAVVENTALAAIPVSPTPLKPLQGSGEVYEQTGQGIIYGHEYAGLPTANGEILDQMGMTAAHPSLPVPSLVQVSNLDTGKEVVLRVNDRGPFEDGAVLQVTQRAADVLGLNGAGRGNLHIRYLGPAPAAATAVPAAQTKPAPAAFARTPASAAKVAAFEAHLKGDADELLGGNGSPQPAVASRSQPVSPTAAARGNGAAVYVQLASFSEFGNADALMRRIANRVPAEIVPARVNGADFFRVRVGPLSDRETANGLRDQFAIEGLADGRVVSGD